MNAAVTPSPELPVVILKPREADRIVAGHPWIYAGALMHVPPGVADGDVVEAVAGGEGLHGGLSLGGWGLVEA